MSDGDLASTREPCLRVLVSALRWWLSPGMELSPWPDLSQDDWTRLISLAGRHAVLPVLARVVRAHAPASLPSSVRDDLGSWLRANTARTLMFSHAAMEVLAQLEAAGVRAAPFKGPVLAQRCYGDLALRTYNDIDILVPPSDVEPAEAILRGLGYRRHGDSDVPDAIYRRTTHARSFRRPKAAGVLLELHWSLAEEYFGFTVHPDELWPRLATIGLMGSRVPCLSSEDLLVFLCVHGAKHGWQRLAWALDVAALLRSAPELRWSLAEGLAARHGVGRVLDLGLHLAHDILGVSLPEPARARISADPVVPLLGKQVLAWWTQGRRMLPGQSERSSLFRLHVQLRRSWHEKIAHALRIVFLPTVDDWRAFPVPPRLFALLALLRPLRLLWQRMRPQAVHASRP